MSVDCACVGCCSCEDVGADACFGKDGFVKWVLDGLMDKGCNGFVNGGYEVEGDGLAWVEVSPCCTALECFI